MTKEEVYNAVIDIQLKHGQGLSGVVTVLGDTAGDFRNHLDALIEEGLIVKMDTGGSIGHPESNYFYMPTKGYNVWEDKKREDGFFANALSFVRLYLDTYDHEEVGLDDVKGVLNPGYLD